MSGNELLQFPCEIDVKAFGAHSEDFEALVVEIVKRHTGDIDTDAISSRPSSGGNYLAVTVRVYAESREQMDNLYRELCAHEHIKMAL